MFITLQQFKYNKYKRYLELGAFVHQSIIICIPFYYLFLLKNGKFIYQLLEIDGTEAEGFSVSGYAPFASLSLFCLYFIFSILWPNANPSTLLTSTNECHIETGRRAGAAKNPIQTLFGLGLAQANKRQRIIVQSGEEKGCEKRSYKGLQGIDNCSTYLPFSSYPHSDPHRPPAHFKPGLRQYDIIIMMKRQIVSIDFKEDQGVILHWNYSDLLRKCKYFRHILVVLSGKLEEAEEFVERYIRGIKPGDLFALMFQGGHQGLKMGQWREKTYNNEFSFKDYIGSGSIEIFNIQSAFQFIQKSLQQINDAPVLNFVLEKPAQIEPLIALVKSRQNERKLTFINSLFCSGRENSLSVSGGVNVMDLEDKQALEFYHQYINQVVIEHARLTITCRNGELSSCEQGDWKNTAFNKIERCYYAPTARYSKDVLHIVNTKIILSGSYELDINLSYKCFNGVVYSSEKKIVINFNHSEFYNRTVAVPRRKRAFVTAEEVQLEESPYGSETLICFEKEIKRKEVDADV